MLSAAIVMGYNGNYNCGEPISCMCFVDRQTGCVAKQCDVGNSA